tara:strand:+ start:29 stop:418 length:390 start_codon:yes stop_codon:yes gene_type:complete
LYSKQKVSDIGIRGEKNNKLKKININRITAYLLVSKKTMKKKFEIIIKVNNCKVIRKYLTFLIFLVIRKLDIIFNNPINPNKKPIKTGSSFSSLFNHTGRYVVKRLNSKKTVEYKEIILKFFVIFIKQI